MAWGSARCLPINSLSFEQALLHRFQMPGLIALGKAYTAVTFLNILKMENQISKKQKQKKSKNPQRRWKFISYLYKVCDQSAPGQLSSMWWLGKVPLTWCIATWKAATLPKRKERAGSLHPGFRCPSLLVQHAAFLHRPLCRTNRSGRLGSALSQEPRSRGGGYCWTQVASTKTALVKSTSTLKSLQKLNKP